MPRLTGFLPETCTAGDTERGDELPSKDEADIFAFTESDIDKGWTGLRPGDIVAFVPSPTATLGKNTPKVRQNPSSADSAADAGTNSRSLEVSEVVYRDQPRPRAIAIVLEKPTDEKRTVGFVVLLKDSFGFIKTAEHENNVRGRLGGDGVLAPGKLTRYHPAPVVTASVQIFFHQSEWTDTANPMVVGQGVSFAIAERQGKFNAIRLLTLAPGSVHIEVRRWCAEAIAPGMAISLARRLGAQRYWYDGRPRATSGRPTRTAARLRLRAAMCSRTAAPML